jgi:hypothetical protein
VHLGTFVDVFCMILYLVSQFQEGDMNLIYFVYFSALPDDDRVRSIVLGGSTVLLIGTFEALFGVATNDETLEVTERRVIRFGARPDEIERSLGPMPRLGVVPPGGLGQERARELGVTDLGAVFQLAESMTFSGGTAEENFAFLHGVLTDRRANRRRETLRRLDEGMRETRHLLSPNSAAILGSPPSPVGPRTPTSPSPGGRERWNSVQQSPDETPRRVARERSRSGSRSRSRFVDIETFFCVTCKKYQKKGLWVMNCVSSERDGYLTKLSVC